MDTGAIIGIAAAVAGLAAARKKKGARKGSSDAAARWKAVVGSSVLGGSLQDLLAGRSLLTPTASPSGRAAAPATFRATRRPGAREMEHEGVPHPLLVRRRRARRKEFLREMANVAMGSAAIGVSTAGLLFDGGAVPEWSLVAGGLAALVFGWIFGREVAHDLIHLGP